MHRVSVRPKDIIWILGVLVIIFIALLHLTGHTGKSVLKFSSFGHLESVRKFGTDIKGITDPDNIERILNMTDRTERMMEIINLLPPQRDWPEDLGMGFKTIKHPFHSIEIDPKMNISEAETLFYGFAVTYNIKCSRFLRLGGTNDGGWFVCLSRPYHLKKPCLVYSLGMGELRMWGFDIEIMDKYGCSVMAFDPTLQKSHHKPYENMWFHNFGIDGRNEVDTHKWTMRTFGTMLKNLGHTKTIIDILKIDIEHSEWRAFESMLLEGALANVRQIAVELHTSELIGKKSNSNDFTYYWLIMKGLDRIGFKYWRHDFNYYRSYKSSHTGVERPILANMNFINANLLL